MYDGRCFTYLRQIWKTQVISPFGDGDNVSKITNIRKYTGGCTQIQYNFKGKHTGVRRRVIKLQCSVGRKRFTQETRNRSD